MSTTKPPTRTTSSTTTPLPPKPTTQIHSLATLADKASLTGPHHIQIAEHTLLHPYAKLLASHGDVTLGAGCLVAEKAVVGLTAGPSSPDPKQKAVVLEDGVSIETNAIVEARRVGSNSTVEVGARVGRGAVVGSWCKIGPLCVVGEGEVLEDFTVVFGVGERRVDRAAREGEEVRKRRVEGRRKEVEVLRGLIPDAGAKWRG